MVLYPFNEYYDSEVLQDEALLEIIRTKQFRYIGEDVDSAYEFKSLD